MGDAFDADVVIHAVSAGPFRDASARALRASTGRVGSVVLLPEVLSQPLRRGDVRELDLLNSLLATFDLKPVDEEVADAAVTLGAKYALKGADAIHLATAVVWGAERFYTNNSKDFGPHIAEIEVAHPSRLE